MRKEFLKSIPASLGRAQDSTPLLRGVPRWVLQIPSIFSPPIASSFAVVVTPTFGRHELSLFTSLRAISVFVMHRPVIPPSITVGISVCISMGFSVAISVVISVVISVSISVGISVRISLGISVLVTISLNSPASVFPLFASLAVIPLASASRGVGILDWKRTSLRDPRFQLHLVFDGLHRRRNLVLRPFHRDDQGNGVSYVDGRHEESVNMRVAVRSFEDAEQVQLQGHGEVKID
mmetsp:Transcript_40757/g.107962  ORF Transcript_40757/g.107962 Transcript_40757/m.107962 type:complete len:236 (+) Transcript_40757:118-825(+)